MTTFQVTCRELVYVDRTYEVEADSADAAYDAVEKSGGQTGFCVDERIQDSHSFCHVLGVFDEDGNDALKA